MKKATITAVLFLFGLLAVANSNNDTSFVETPVLLHTTTGDLSGTLTTPKGSGLVPVALLIAGSGPTDRNGDNPAMKNASLEKLAYGLANNNIASLRYDKRGVGESKNAGKTEADLRFQDYVADAKEWIELLKKEARFSKIIVVGHSEGSLIGMMAALHLADGFVSLAGAGKPADKIIREQLASQPPAVQDLCFPILDSLVAGKTVTTVNPALYALFRPSVQPYLISWFRVDPQVEIQKLTIPVLLVQGTADIQVAVADAEALAKANAHAQLKLIENMNHIFRIVTGDRNANIATYSNAGLPISAELVNAISAFIKTI